MRFALIAVALAACSKGGGGGKATPAPDAAAKAKPAPDAAPPDHFDATIDGKPVALVAVHALVGAINNVHQGLILRFSDREETCGSIDRARTAPLEILLSPGPGDRYFAGAPQPAQAMTLRSLEGAPDVRPADVKLVLDEFEAKQGRRITGTLDIEATSPIAISVHGRLDAEICGDPVPVGLPASVPDQPVAGRLTRSQPRRDGTVEEVVEEIRVGTALAYVRTTIGVEELDAVSLHPAGVTCATGQTDDARMNGEGHVSFWSVPLSALPIGELRPAWFSRATGAHSILSMHGWVRFEEVSAGEVRLAVAAAIAGPDPGERTGQLAGTIRATICR